MSVTKILIGLALAAFSGLLSLSVGLSESISWTIAITMLTASWWVSEAVPIPVASLVPFALFPLAGVIDQRQASSALGSYVIILLMASFMLSKALEKSNLHERLALYMIKIVGSSARRLVLGFMIAAAFLSMWISNTATTLMLATMALAILSRTDDAKLAVPLLLGIAYAASIGGTATLIGTPPNLIFAENYLLATGIEFSFAKWMSIGLPAVAIALPLMWLWLTRAIGDVKTPELRAVGPWTAPEARTMIVFGAAILMWVTRIDPFGGWSGALGITLAGDSTVAVLAVIIMFLVPDGRGGALLDWRTASDIPWGMLLLFAGGICIAIAFRESGLADLIGERLATLTALPVFAMIVCLCLGVTFLTEITSNTATANLLMPVLAALAIGSDIAPELLMIPAAISASCAFMLPVATAPNAIIYGTGRVSIGRMAREGSVLNVLVALIVASVCYVMLG